MASKKCILCDKQNDDPGYNICSECYKAYSKQPRMKSWEWDEMAKTKKPLAEAKNEEFYTIEVRIINQSEKRPGDLSGRLNYGENVWLRVTPDSLLRWESLVKFQKENFVDARVVLRRLNGIIKGYSPISRKWLVFKNKEDAEDVLLLAERYNEINKQVAELAMQRLLENEEMNNGD